MIKVLRTVALGLALSLGTATAETGGLFVGANVVDTDEDDLGGVTVSGLSFQLGYQHNPYVGVDGRVSVFSNESDSIFRNPLIKQYSLLGRFGYAWEQISVYALLGYSNMLMASHSEDGFSRGLEINLFGSPNTAISIGYLSQAVNGDSGDFNFDAVSIGFIHLLNVKASSFKLRHPSKD